MPEPQIQVDPNRVLQKLQQQLADASFRAAAAEAAAEQQQATIVDLERALDEANKNRETRRAESRNGRAKGKVVAPK